MNATKLILAAGFAIAATSAFAETGVVVTNQVNDVAAVYGRAGVANVKIVGGKVADSGAGSTAETKLAVTAGKDVIEFGRG